MAEFPTSHAPAKLPFVALAAGAALALLAFPVLEPGPNRALAVLVFAAILWVTEAIPLALTALLIPVMASILGLLTVKVAFAEFANPVIFLFMGGFVLAGALQAQALDQFMARRFMHMAGGNFFRAAVMLMLATAILAGWIGNTSVTAMMMPLGIGLLALAQRDFSCGESRFLMLGIAYSANIGGVMTVIGTPPNAIGAAILNLSFSQWIRYGLPIFLITFPLMVLAMALYFRPNQNLAVGAAPAPEKLKPGTTKLLTIFALTVFLWMAEGVLAPPLGLQNGFSALVAVGCVAMLYLSGLMRWPAILESVRWDILLLFGGGLTLGVIVEQSGLGAILIVKVMALQAGSPQVLSLWLIVLFTIILTEVMSNTASAALLIPMLYALATHTNTPPEVLVLPATIAASYGFMLPVGTPPNAMVFGTGYIPQRDMIKIGLVLNVLFSIVLTLLFVYVY